MPRKDDELDFKIFVDPSCLSDPMDGETTTTSMAAPADVPEIIDIPADIPVASAGADNDAPEELQSKEGDTLEAAEEPTSVEPAQDDTLDREAAEEIEETVEEATDKSLLHETHEAVHADDYDAQDNAHESLVADGRETDEAAGEHEQENADEPLRDNTQNADEIGEDAETPKPARVRQIEDDTNEFQPTDRKTSLRTEALIQAAARAVVAKLEKRSNRDSTSQADEEADHSLLSTGTHNMYDSERHSAYDDFGQSRRESTDSQIHHDIPSRSVSGDEGGDSSSHHEADDDVFSDRSARSSLGSFDGPSDDNKPLSNHGSLRNSGGTVGRSPRISGVSIISGLSQYDKEDFVPTNRETRLPFRTPSAVRAMQMASPTPSVFDGASPRSGKRQTGTPRNHLQSPTASAQYSPKGRSTPTRLKSRKQAPLVLLHVTLLPLRWMWGDVLDGLDPINGRALDENKEIFQASEHLKTLRDTWRELQDCVGETVLERGILIPHPQDDFEVLEERLLEALELPQRRRARILECGHYLGPTSVDSEYESDDEYASESDAEKRHWCATCKGDIRYESLGPGKVFRLKVYASNGLMKAGAWEACWRDMERVDVEVEPIVEPAVQAELEKLAAVRMEQEERRQQEAEAEAEVEAELRRQEEERAEARAEEAEAEGSPDETLPIVSEPELPHAEGNSQPIASSPPPVSMQIMHASPPQAFSSPDMRMTRPMQSEPIDTSEERQRRDEERLREIYGDIPTPQPYSEIDSAHVEPGSSRPRHPDSYIPPPTPRSPSEEVWERRQHQRDTQRRALDDASFIELMLEAFKVLLRDSKNVAIIVLCLFLVCLMIRPTPQFPSDHNRLAYYEPKQDVVMHTPVAKVEVHTEATRAPSVRSSVAMAKALEGPSVESDIAVVPVASEVPVRVRPVEHPSRSQLALDAPEVTDEAAPTWESLATAENPAAIENLDADTKSIPGVVEAVVETVDPENRDDSVESTTDLPGLEPASEPESSSVSPDSLETPTPGEIDASRDEPESTGEIETSPLVAPSAEADQIALGQPVAEVAPPAAAPVEVETLSTATESATESATEAAEATEPTGALTEATTATLEPATEVAESPQAHPCESYAQSARLSAAQVSHVFPVTERKTIRVYETITETVRVSVTATETASFVETAVPQTVEETVYETETVRITVSIPVDSAPEPSARRDEL